jgi:putative peptidoglycan lipid II flippase
LAISVALGGVLQLGYQLPYMRQIGMLTWPRLRRHSPGVKRVLALMVPAIFGVSAPQISLMLNSNFASYLPEGSLSWMNYADRFMELPNGVLAVALGTILLPSLSKLQAAKRHDEYSSMLDWGLRLCWLLALPATVAMGVIAVPIISTLFLSPKFASHDVLMTARALSAYAVGLMGLVSIKILAPAYYARQDFKTPVKIGFVSVAITQLLNVAFLHYTSLAHAGLSLSVSLGGCVNAALLYMGLRRSGVYRPEAGWIRFLGQLALAVAAMALVIGLLKTWLGSWFAGHLLVRAIKLTVVITAGIGTYFATLYLMGFRLADFSKRAA